MSETIFEDISSNFITSKVFNSRFAVKDKITINGVAVDFTVRPNQVDEMVLGEMQKYIDEKDYTSAVSLIKEIQSTAGEKDRLLAGLISDSVAKDTSSAKILVKTFKLQLTNAQLVFQLAIANLYRKALVNAANELERQSKYLLSQE